MAGKETSGKKENQKMKPYLVYEYLYRNSDASHTCGAPEIISYLQSLGIDAERRSIYKDIDAINKALWILNKNSNFEELEKAISDGSFDLEKSIVYDGHQKGFYIANKKEPEEKSSSSEAKAISSDPSRPKEKVRLQFANSVMDSVSSFLGSSNYLAIKKDERFTILTAEVEINNQFLGWLCSFGVNATILAPESLKNRFVRYLDKIKDKYW